MQQKEAGKKRKSGAVSAAAEGKAAKVLLSLTAHKHVFRYVCVLFRARG